VLSEPALGIMVTSASLLEASPNLQKSSNSEYLNVFVIFLAKEIVNNKKFGKTFTEHE